MFDGEAFGSDIVSAVKSYVDKQTAPLLARIAGLEAKLVEQPVAPGPDLSAVGEMIAEAMAALPIPKDGADADPEAIAQMVAQAVADIPAPKDGQSVSLEDVAPMIAEAVAEAVAALPVPEPGKDADPEAVRDIVRAEVEAVAPKAEDIERQVAEQVQAAVSALPVPKDGEDGKSVDPEQVAALFAEAIAAVPLPQDGKSVTVEDIAPLVAEEVQRAVAMIPAAKDGVGLAGAVIDREGSLILTLTNGETRDLGGVIGRDADVESIARRIEELVAEIPRPKDGKDGFSLDDFDTEMKEDGRTILLKFTSGDTTETHELCFPLVIDRGVYNAAAEYARGDGVTWGGSFWIAQRDTSAKPETSDDWRLAVKRGRDGKNGDPGKPGEPGKKGDPGRDGRAYT